MINPRWIWFDLTTSLHWSRPAVGIVRMEQECCRQLLSKIPDRMRFCVYDQQNARYVELSRQRAWQILKGIREPQLPPVEIPAAIAPLAPEPHAPPVPPVRAIKRIEMQVRRVVFAALSVLPEAHQAAIRRRMVAVRRTLAFGYHQWKAAGTVEPTVHETAPMAPGVAEGLNAPAPSTAMVPAVHDVSMSPPSSIFSSGDCYLTMGLDWDHDKLGTLYEEKRRTGLRVMSVAYDIIPVKFPHFYPSGKFDLFSVYFADMAWTADHVFCISQRTARDLHAFYDDIGAPQPSSSVVRLGDVLPKQASMEHVQSKALQRLIGSPYLLFVSTIEIRKNHETLYKAYVRLIEEGFDVPKLVFVGMSGWRIDDFMYSLQNDPRVQSKIVVLNQVTDADLSVLYKNCMFTLYPSLYEGWGLPVAESLAYGKFCLASNAASIPEIAGDIIDYADPWSVPEWTEKIRLYCSNPHALKERENLVSSHFRSTSWQATVDQMIEVIEREASVSCVPS